MARQFKARTAYSSAGADTGTGITLLTAFIEKLRTSLFFSEMDSSRFGTMRDDLIDRSKATLTTKI